jgi:eukaryotic translation initiation factor 2C
MPKRIIIFRNGSSEGNFDALLTTEVASIRAAFAMLRRDHEMDECRNECEGKGCAFCTPIITYIVALSQHNIRMVPKNFIPHGKQGNPRNVLSGTCVDNTINTYWDDNGFAVEPAGEKERILSQNVTSPVQLFEDVKGGFDFLLTAHGGLKGTSKPIFYRVVLNENVVWRPSAENEVTPLTKDELQLITYHMSYQYATATKAVRMVPVIYYSHRLANVAVGYVGCKYK